MNCDCVGDGCCQSFYGLQGCKKYQAGFVDGVRIGSATDSSPTAGLERAGALSAKENRQPDDPLSDSARQQQETEQVTDDDSGARAPARSTASFADAETETLPHDVLREVLNWAEARCPCEDGLPDPCSLCGARSEHDHCMAADATFPGVLLRRIRDAVKIGSGTVSPQEHADATSRSNAQKSSSQSETFSLPETPPRQEKE